MLSFLVDEKKGRKCKEDDDEKKEKPDTFMEDQVEGSDSKAMGPPPTTSTDFRAKVLA